MKEIIKNYFITPCGKIYNRKGLHRKTYNHPNGYEIFPYWLDGKFKTTPVHRLVALAYIPNPENKPCVNHIDGNKLNNDISNLEWVTYSENTLHALQTGLKIPELGEDVHNSSITNSQCHEICKAMADGARNKELCKMFNVSSHTIKNIRSGKGWSHISKDYVIPKKPSLLADDTVHWICQKMVDGLKNKEIVALSKNDMVNKSVVTRIRNKRGYTRISAMYNL